MDEDRLHRAVSADGTEIAGRVRGHGPPLILVHGGLGDGDLSWNSLLPYLTDRFTCYLMSTRGRGLSAEPSPPDYSLERLVEDVVAFAESVGEPVGLVGHSLGGMLVLGAAARSPAVSVAAVYEPAVFEALSEEDAARFAEAGARMAEAANEGRLVDAVRSMIEVGATEDEMAALSASGHFEAFARYVPVALEEIKQAGESEAPRPTAPSALGRITVPLLYLHGSPDRTWYIEGARYVAEHVADPRVVEIAEVGHFGHFLHPERFVEGLIGFFNATHERPEPSGLTYNCTTGEKAMATENEGQLDRTVSRDGTEIGYWTTGEGPSLLLIHGGLGDHTRWEALRPHLEPHVTVHAMDRRGRGASGDGSEYSIEREYEDVAAVVDAIAETSGSLVDVYCSSYGGLCAFGGAPLTSNIRRLALYEAWPPVDPEAHAPPPGLVERVEALVAEGSREAALETAYRELLGLPEEELETLRVQPSWPARVAAIHTGPRELRAFLETSFDPDQAASITVPTVLLTGSESPAWRAEAESVAAALSDARIAVLEGQGHVADLFAPELIAETLLPFLREGYSGATDES
jgi:pimeloyl-ACP methyl ester carboxylesterase